MDVAHPVGPAEQQQQQLGSEADPTSREAPHESAAQAAMAVALRSGGGGRWGGFGPNADWGRATQAPGGLTAAAEGIYVAEPTDSAQQPPTASDAEIAEAMAPDSRTIAAREGLAGRAEVSPTALFCPFNWGM